MLHTKRRKYFIHLLLFLITLLTTTLAGAEWMHVERYFFSGKNPLGWQEFKLGLLYSVPFLGILTVHEFGHYLTARLYKVKVSLPYYIPIWFGGMPSIGTMGAFIRIQSALRTRQQFFDIGIAGPLAGFVLAIGVIWYGFTHLPPPEYIFTIHPEYAKYGLKYADYVYKDASFSFALGSNLIFQFFEHFVVADPSLVPNSYEMMHYPFLLAGYLALFFTGLNLIPIGQLDGGHILYGLIGYKNHAIVSPILFVAFVFYAGLGVISPGAVDLLFFQFPLSAGYAVYFSGILLYIGFLYLVFLKTMHTPKRTLLLSLIVCTTQYMLTSFFGLTGYHGWLVFAFVLGRFLGVYHPPALYDIPLDGRRKLLGWLTILIFIACFSPEPFIVEEASNLNR